MYIKVTFFEFNFIIDFPEHRSTLHTKYKFLDLLFLKYFHCNAIEWLFANNEPNMNSQLNKIPRVQFKSPNDY